MPSDLALIRSRLEAGEHLRFAGLGDSLTEGWMVEWGFFDRFCDLVRERWPGATLEGENEGIPGDTAAGGLARLGPILERQPDLLTVEFALNDCFCGVSADRFIGQLSQMVALARSAGTVVVLCTSCPLKWPGERAAADSFYEAIRHLGAKEGVPVADLESDWLAEDPDPDAGHLLQDDGVHPNDAGHAVMARGLLNCLCERPFAL